MIRNLAAPPLTYRAFEESNSGVELLGVGHAFQADAYLFRNLTRKFIPGTRTALIGPSGSGKSTLLSILAGVQEPTEGSRQLSFANNPRIRWAFQNPHGVATRTAVDHVVLPLLASGRERKRAEAMAIELLSRFDLRNVEKQVYSRLSGGEQQRLLLCRAMASEPDLLLIDEPTAQLDRHSATKVNAALRAMSAALGTVIIVATHDSETRDACDELVDLADFQ